MRDVTALYMGDPGTSPRRAPTLAEANHSKPYAPTSRQTRAQDRLDAEALEPGKSMRCASYTRANHLQYQLRKQGIRATVRTDYNGGAYLTRTA